MVAESWKNPLDWYKTNLISQVALHDELRKRKHIEKYVHFTTPEVYGDTKNDWIIENKKFAPSTPYAVSRASCDLHLESFFNAYNFPVVFTRAANVYGPGQQLYRIVPRSILSCLNGKKLDLHGGGLSERSFIHISDTIEATIKIALEAEPGNSYHISTNESISIKGLVQKICNLMQVDYELVVNITEDRLGKDQSYLLNSDKLRDQFDWTEKYNLNDGLIDTIKWVKENNKIMKKLSWDYLHKA
jgi:dTDP-glucose 4,6-dehydratase